MRTREVIALILAVGVFTGVAPGRGYAQPGSNPDSSDRTPPRLSFVDGQVSFWRPGAQDWAQAQVNTPLAPGDELATASPGNVEVQIGARAFVRASANTQVGLANQEPDSSSKSPRGPPPSTSVRSSRGTRWKWTRPTPRSPSSALATIAWT